MWTGLTVLFLAAASHEPSMSGRALMAAAGKSADTQRELEQALGAPGQATVHLRSDITVSKCLKVKGTKVLDGGGKYRIRRKAASGATYKGTLFQMQGNMFKLKDVTVSGSGKSVSVSGDINGKLIEIDSGTVVLASGARLNANYNLSTLTDGGGGITVHAGGTAVMKDGSAIRDNLTITGGSGVRVEPGGMFIMEGGTIADNAVLGQGKGTDFDGRGGAVHNRGIVMIQGGTIMRNAAAGYENGGESYGGFGGAIYNQSTLTVTGGTIKNNRATFAGGAVYTNESGTVSMEGGKICNNSSAGMRGGGIYISASSTVSMDGGTICDNTAEDGTQIFLSSTSSGRFTIRGGSVSGDRDVIYNNGGMVSVRGGAVTSRECALKTKGSCEIRGGVVRGGTYGIKYGDGNLSVSGDPHINSVYLTEGQVIHADRNAAFDVPCELCPAHYGEGVKLVHISSGQKAEDVRKSFSLKEKGKFILETRDDGLYIEREKYRIVFDANGGQGNMEEQWVYVNKETALRKCAFWREGYAFAGWAADRTVVKKPEDITYRERQKVKNLTAHGKTVCLFALWIKRPVLTSEHDGVVFYEGEYVDRRVLLHGMRAQDECDGDISWQIGVDKIILPGGPERTLPDKLPTSKARLGKGEIVYRVTNSFGVSTEYRQMYEVVPNQEPEIKVWDRYFFTGEYPGSLDARAEQDILSNICVNDDVETGQQLETNRTVFWGGLNLSGEGEYKVTVRVKDQYGHRFYMPEGEERQYGSGKVCEKTFSVYVVKKDNPDTETEKDGFVRFISEDYMYTLPDHSIWRTEAYTDELDGTFHREAGNYEEVWSISGGDKKRIKEFAREMEDPFSQQTNKMFLEKFSYMREERDGD